MDEAELVGTWVKSSHSTFQLTLHAEGTSVAILRTDVGRHRYQWEWRSSWRVRGSRLCFEPCVREVFKVDNATDLVHDKEIIDVPSEEWIIDSLIPTELIVRYGENDKPRTFRRIFDAPAKLSTYCSQS